MQRVSGAYLLNFDCPIMVPIYFRNYCKPQMDFNETIRKVIRFCIRLAVSNAVDFKL